MKLIALLLLFTAAPLAAPCSGRTEGRRKTSVIRAFKKATGYPNGRPGYVVDHIVPLCACGSDATYNLQWQEYTVSRQKDAFELQMCAALRRVAGDEQEAAQLEAAAARLLKK